MKKIVLRTLEIVIFICLLVTMIFKVSLFEKSFGKGITNDRNACLFYELPYNTVDVMLVGDSHIHSSFIPKLIYDESGITSAIFATSNQSIINTYWAVEEAIKQQEIKVLVIDVHSIEDTLRKGNDYLHFTSGILMLPDFSFNKVKCLNDIKEANYGISKDITENNVYGFLQFKDDYERNGSIKEFINLLVNPKKQFKTLGYNPMVDVEKNDSPLVIGDENKDNEFTGSITNMYMDKIIDLCNSNGINLIITRNLYTSKTASIKSFDAIIDWADNNNVRVIDYFELIDELGFNTDTDFANATHLNYGGAKKATKYLIDVLVNEYELIDHRGDKKYRLWENNDFDYNSIEIELNKNIESQNK